MRRLLCGGFLFLSCFCLITISSQAYVSYLPRYSVYFEDSVQEFIDQYRDDHLENVRNFALRIENEGFPEFTYDGKKTSYTYRINIDRYESCEDFISPIFPDTYPLYETCRPYITVTYLQPETIKRLSKEGPFAFAAPSAQQIRLNLNGTKVDACLQSYNTKEGEFKKIYFYDRYWREISFESYYEYSVEDFISEVERYGIVYHHGQSFYTVLFCSIVGAVLLTGGILAFVLIRRRKKCALFKNPESSATEDIRSPEPSVSKDTE